MSTAELRDKLVAIGFTKVHGLRYATDLSQGEISKISNLLHADIGDHACVLSDKDAKHEVPQFGMAYISDGADVSIQLITSSTTVRSQVCTIFVKDDDSLNETKVRIANFVNKARLFLGFHTFLTRLPDVTWDVEADKRHLQSPLMQHIGIQKLSLSDQRLSFLRELVTTDLEAEAGIFMEDAFGATSVSRALLYLWTALEIQVGDGKKRKKFCEDALESHLVSHDLRLIHQKRSDYVHKGESSLITSFDLVVTLMVMAASVSRNADFRRDVGASLERLLVSSYIQSEIAGSTQAV